MESPEDIEKALAALVPSALSARGQHSLDELIDSLAAGEAPLAELPEPEPDHFDAGPFIPPAAESPIVRPQRLPQIEDLPVPAQKQIRAQRGEPAEPLPAHDRRKSLLERLAAFGVSRHEEPQRHAAPPAREPAPRIAAPAPRLAQPNPVHAEYGKRVPQQPSPRQVQAALDAHQARATAPARSIEEEQLEIPAFLRRQSN